MGSIPEHQIYFDSSAGRLKQNYNKGEVGPGFRAACFPLLHFASVCFLFSSP